ncbi:hypothetical protein COB64_02325 [Candidatus Wolfebacteria bacterium]|nr:MAG: hypothetical protein COB64_02325 [Candidatus Wolfebacteria bacterium]
MKIKIILFVIIGLFIFGTQTLSQNGPYSAKFSESRLQDTVEVLVHTGNYCEDIELTCPPTLLKRSNYKNVCTCSFTIYSKSKSDAKIRFLNKRETEYRYIELGLDSCTIDIKDNVENYYRSCVSFKADKTEKISFISEENECFPIIIRRTILVYW